MTDHVCGRPAENQSLFRGPINVNEPERLTSAAIGGFLLALGMARSTNWQRMASLLAGAGLVYRGLSGNCMMYRLMGRLRDDEGRRVDAQIDEAVEDSFPASDPPAFTASAASRSQEVG